MLNEQQQAVIDFARTSPKGTSLNLIARAGCGKTFTAIELIDWLIKNTTEECFIGAYNKSIGEELKSKLQKRGIPWQRATAGTMHSAGFQAWRKVAPNVQVKADKVKAIIGELAQQDEYKAAAATFNGVTGKLVSLGKQRAFGFLVPIEDRGEWFDIIDHFGLDEDLPDNAYLDQLVDFAIAVYRRSLDMDKECIDFDDMILAPLVHNARVWPKDWVIIDEAQDTNPARRALAIKMVRPKTGRLVAIGDPAQAIYGFTGADSDSMDLIREHMGSQVLPLNVTYRCGHSIIALAQRWVPDIQAFDSNPNGTVRHILLDAKPIGEVKVPDFWDEDLSGKQVNGEKEYPVVLCRNTKPLVELAYGLLRRKVACHVEGREIAGGLLKLIHRWKVTSLNTLIDKLTAYKDKQVQHWLAKDKPNKAQDVEDRVDTIICLAEPLIQERKARVEDLTALIDSMFGDTPEGQRPHNLTLATVHKSKGREWDRVYLLGRSKYMPSKYAKKQWQLQQENNLMYVAVTRAKSELVEVIVP